VTHPLSEDRSHLVGPALRTFFNIAALWGLNDGQKMRLLGLGSETTLKVWEAAGRGEAIVTLPADTLDRISHVFAIYRALQALFPQTGRAANWVRAPNKAPIFGGRPALERMTSGSISDLAAVRSYIEAQLY
jgi:hypothetical protein